jgi:hypothetical protein
LIRRGGRDIIIELIMALCYLENIIEHFGHEFMEIMGKGSRRESLA